MTTRPASTSSSVSEAPRDSWVRTRPEWVRQRSSPSSPASLAPGGTLVVDVANELGLHELLAAQPQLDVDSDDAWHVGGDGFNHRRLHLAELEDAGQDLGLTPDALFGAYPTPDTHHLLVDGAALVAGEPGLTAAARLHSCRAAERHFRDIPALRDPRSTVERLVDGGVVTQLAPAWVLVAHLGEAAPPLDLPAVIDAETWVDPAWARVNTVDHAGASTARVGEREHRR